jgi:Rrf2 family transcriptional regulator, nitric oxide-sensitive transcriptional repressor
VVRDTEGAAQPAECFQSGGGHCAIGHCCELRGVLAEAVQAFHASLDRHTLADLVRDRRSIVHALHIHRLPAPAHGG